MSLIPSWRVITRRTLDLFGRWGDTRTNLRSMLDGIIPVVVVDDFRDDDRGSVFGINAFTLGTANELPSLSFGSSVNDWELLGFTNLVIDYQGGGGSKIVALHLFTPIFPYNPATTVTPVGFFTPGILPNRAFTFGSVVGIGGSNPVAPAVFGPRIGGGQVTSQTGRLVVQFELGVGLFPHVPIRMYRDVTLTVQYVGTIPVGVPVGLEVSILYRERPKVSQ